jgi:hypothetical protein
MWCGRVIRVQCAARIWWNSWRLCLFPGIMVFVAWWRDSACPVEGEQLGRGQFLPVVEVDQV